MSNSGNDTLLMTLDGEVIRKFVLPKSSGSQVDCCISNHGEFVISLTDEGILHCFEFATGKLVKSIKTGSKRAIGLKLHPTKNILICYFQEGILKVFKA